MTHGAHGTDEEICAPSSCESPMDRETDTEVSLRVDGKILLISEATLVFIGDIC